MFQLCLRHETKSILLTIRSFLFFCPSLNKMFLQIDILALIQPELWILIPHQIIVIRKFCFLMKQVLLVWSLMLDRYHPQNLKLLTLFDGQIPSLCEMSGIKGDQATTHRPQSLSDWNFLKVLLSVEGNRRVYQYQVLV